MNSLLQWMWKVPGIPATSFELIDATCSFMFRHVRPRSFLNPILHGIFNLLLDFLLLRRNDKKIKILKSLRKIKIMEDMIYLCLTFMIYMNFFVWKIVFAQQQWHKKLSRMLWDIQVYMKVYIYIWRLKQRNRKWLFSWRNKRNTQ